MKRIVLLIVFTFFSVIFSEAQPKISSKQERLSAYIQKYEDMIFSAPDSATRTKIYFELWKTHMKFIQDTLKMFHNTHDTFIFKNAIIKDFIYPKDKKEYLKIFLDNGNFFAMLIFSGTTNENFRKTPIYRQSKKIKPNSPVKAVIDLQGFNLQYPDIYSDSKSIMLNIQLDALYNIEQKSGSNIAYDMKLGGKSEH